MVYKKYNELLSINYRLNFMDYSRPALIDALASSYVQGTLHGGARRRYECLLLAHPMLRKATLQWQARLAPLSQSIPPLTPPPAVWGRIEQRLFGKTISTASWWQLLLDNLLIWRVSTGLLACLVMYGFSLYQTTSQAPLVIVMNASNGTQQFVASLNQDGKSVVLTPVSNQALAPTGKSLQLWALPKAGTPYSLGVLTHLSIKTNINVLNANALAISLEPIGGSPTGLPTGAVIASGTF
jgi:anti-sigma-K factor RskA